MAEKSNSNKTNLKKDDLKKLSPEERIKKLRDLKKQRKKELDEAEKLIKESTDEIAAREVIERDELILELAVLEGREKPSAKKTKDIEKLEELDDLEDVAESRKKPSKPTYLVEEQAGLEGAIGREHIDLPPEVLQSQYTATLSQRPVYQLQEDVARIQEVAEARGYLREEEQRAIEYRLGAVEKKREEGYSFTKEAGRAASLIEQMGSQLLGRSMYKSDSKDIYHAG